MMIHLSVQVMQCVAWGGTTVILKFLLALIFGASDDVSVSVRGKTLLLMISMYMLDFNSSDTLL